MSERSPGPIGIFDSGLGGLTIYKEIRASLPDHDYIYLGDNARTPYGTRSLEIVHRYTLEAVRYLRSNGCHLIILACNTASAMALRSIQQRDMHGPDFHEMDRVLGILRPTTEIMGSLTKSGHMGLFATEGTVAAESYMIESAKFAPEVRVHQQACPLWVPLVENDEVDSLAADALVKKYVDQLLAQDERIDSVLLACTHYPLLMKVIRKHLPDHIDIVTQGQLVAASLVNYLSRHQELDKMCSRGGSQRFLTTGDRASFEARAARFFGEDLKAEEVDLQA